MGIMILDLKTPVIVMLIKNGCVFNLEWLSIDSYDFCNKSFIFVSFVTLAWLWMPSWKSNALIYFQYLLIKTFMTYLLKILILRLRLRPTAQGQSLSALNILLRPKAKIATTVQHCTWTPQFSDLLCFTYFLGRFGNIKEAF